MREPERISIEEYRILALENSGAKKPGGRSSKKPSLRIPKVKYDAAPMAVLARLMRATKTSARIVLQPEERLAAAFATALRAAVLEKRLRAVWTHPANEIAGRRSGLSQIRYAIAKSMGLIDGTADYLFLASDGSGALEAKVGRNGLQDNQKDFQAWCEMNGVKHAVFRTVEEGLEALVKWGFLIPEGQAQTATERVSVGKTT